MDIKGFFMNINKQILFGQIEQFLQNKKDKLTIDYDFLIKLIHQVIFHDPTRECIVK